MPGSILVPDRGERAPAAALMCNFPIRRGSALMEYSSERSSTSSGICSMDVMGPRAMDQEHGRRDRVDSSRPVQMLEE